MVLFVQAATLRQVGLLSLSAERYIYLQPNAICTPVSYPITGMQQTEFNLLEHVPTLYLYCGQGTPCSGITEVARNDLHLFSEPHHRQVKRCFKVVSCCALCKLTEAHLLKRYS